MRNRMLSCLGVLAVAAVAVVSQSAITAQGQKDAAAVRKELAAVPNGSMPMSKNWTLEQILSLNRDSLLTLWGTLPPVPVNEMKGHMQGFVPNAGVKDRQARSLDYMFNETSTRGYWLGKTFTQTGPNKGEGYNMWRFPGGKIVRNLRVGTSVGPSLIDGKPSFLIDYSAFNPKNTLIDEMRKLDDYIFLGAATTAGADGKRTPPEHFVLAGPVDEWVPFPATPAATTSRR